MLRYQAHLAPEEGKVVNEQNGAPPVAHLQHLLVDECCADDLCFHRKGADRYPHERNLQTVAKRFHRQRLPRVRRTMEQDWWNPMLTPSHHAKHTQKLCADCELVHLLLSAPLPPGPLPRRPGADMATWGITDVRISSFACSSSIR